MSRLKKIIIRESYDWITIDSNKEGSITKEEYEDLINYLDNNYEIDKIVQIGLNKLRFINYVGFIQLPSVYLEILPKLSLDNNIHDLTKDRNMLMFMLSKVGYFPVSLSYNSFQNYNKYNLIELFAHFFINELQRGINKGLHYEYIKVQDNLNKLKGRIIIKNQIRYNYSKKYKAFCEYSKFTINNFLNQVFKKTIKLLVTNINNIDLKKDIKILQSYFKDVDDIVINSDKLNKIIFDRQNERFKIPYLIAKFILSNLTFSSNVGLNQSFSFLFEMNTLFEMYIAKLVNEIWSNDGEYTSIQDNVKYLLINVNNERNNIKLKPDIVLYKTKFNNKRSAKVIIDTKWKHVDKVQQSDIYQMYAYITSYNEASRCILLYPRVYTDKDYPIWRIKNTSEKKFIEVRTVRLDSFTNTIFDLKKIIYDNTIG
ncbi:hypothetical protein TR13x_03870 [Caloranaerobacter sp. TR13]|uniref:McrC family protein n=1 Tax=Caloranaerobacter sp. TR13 TaxID=1302151 RepID=UPI0006D44E75|nr:McrC family protein [Caloranaerobacter sp. TR13]KPU27672.1 hypothetical protein TR13x_03870 [Caloranaerobacter sp. TR13]